MNTKSIFKILTIFILGMGIGAFVMGGFVKHKMAKIHRHHSGKGFSHALIHITEAEGEEKERLEALGKEYGDLLNTLQREHFDKRAEVLKDLEAKGITFLTGESKEKFQEHLRRMRKGPPGRKKKKED